MGSGAGKVKLHTDGDVAVVIIDAATTQTRPLKKFVSAFIKREAASVRPWFGPFEVRIWTSVMSEKPGAHDVDNVAKAILDALDGVFWRDDRQVVRLISERFTGDANRIAVKITPLKKEIEPIELDKTLLDEA
ncbi:RusA family crossover junction endodeoxyribonuclease [Parvularcula sp. ZS-1/3]|uniref:RusA family crossover junction endodeoxyribonuclease n=1 Tax=Parvularcula mediterranea TaxID=2732508 RepID=A0A7Y3RPA5_9PROT|nr:RusA family crossover junction endodeoxyribonuclease [Parvularcula mediterranea]NNU17665.1 RusA family crossover junction endodeoxyribonuclease [Parvularcula mediterranea]